MSLGVLRQGARIDVEVPMTIFDVDHAEGRQYDELPHYYIHGGLVFTPLSLDYLASLGSDFGAGSWPQLVYELRLRPYTEAPVDVPPTGSAMKAATVSGPSRSSTSSRALPLQLGHSPLSPRHRQWYG